MACGGICRLEGSEYLIALGPTSPRSIRKMCKADLHREEHYSYDVASYEYQKISFTMLKLDTTQSSRPQLKDTVGLKSNPGSQPSKCLLIIVPSLVQSY